jgi:sirohydrochlorin cobaltochelatase
VSPTIASFPALVLAGHGTRDAAGQAVAAGLVAAVQRTLPGIRVQPAYVDNQAPGVRTALGELAADGITRAAVVPLLLTAASHSKTDVSAAVQSARHDLPALTVSYGRPLGPHPLLLSALRERLAAAGVRPDGPDAADTAVVLAAAGAADADANAEVTKVARLLLEGSQWAFVEAAFASATRPSVPDVVSMLRRLGVPRVVVAPYFLAPGFLVNRVLRQAEEAGADVMSEVLGDHADVARLVVERYREALGGDIRMNCDTCAHRGVIAPRRQELTEPLTRPLTRKVVAS